MWEHQSTLISFNLHSILEEKNQSCICACIMTCKKTVLRVTTKTDATWRLDKSIHQSIESKFCSHLDEIAFAEIFVCWCWSTRFPACTGLSLAATNKFSLNAHNNTFISIDQLPYSNVALKISLFTWGAEGRQSPMAGEMVLAGTTTLKYSPHIAHKSSSKLYSELFSFKDEIEHSWVPYTESFH